MIQAQLADGRVLEFPEGTDPKVIQTTVKRMLGESKATPPKAPQQTQGWQYDDQGYSEREREERAAFHTTPDVAKSFVEPALTVASGILAEPVAGVAGMVQALRPSQPEGAGAQAVEATREALTYQPRSEAGKQSMTELGKVIEPLGKGINAVEKGLGDFVFDLTGSAALAAAAASTPTIAGEVLGLRGLRSIRTGERLIDATGKPTRVLKKALNKEGLDFNSLSPEVKKLIPETLDPGMLPGAKPIKPEIEKIVINQIESGAKDNALATLKVTDGKLGADKLGTTAVKQGFRDGFVQAVKTASKPTKIKMRRMINTMRKIKKNERIGLDTRPSDVIGDSITERLGFIRDKADVARKELDKIAVTKLAGQNIDQTHTLQTLKGILDDLEIGFKVDAKGKPILDFDGSLIVEDKTSQRTIKGIVNIMSKGGQPDALRFHKIKKMLDNQIDYNKKSAMGLTAQGERALKKVRRALNDSLREANPDYARVNDTLSTALTAIGDLDKSVGSIDILGIGSNKALGTKMRALMSNQVGRVKMENAVDQINDATKKLGGTFTDDIKDLVMFADGLDDRFGTTARTSFAGQIEQSIGQAARQNPKTTIVDTAVKGAVKGAKKLRGINDFEAYEALDALLR